ncbi:unnamed protein product [Aphanomyces euteiches]
MLNGWEKAHCEIGCVMRFPLLALVWIALFSTTDFVSGQDVTLDQAVNNEKAAWNAPLPGIYNPSSNEQLSSHGRLLREMKAANHDNEQPGIASEGTVVRPRRGRRNRHKKHRGARKARRQNWATNAYNKVKPYAGPAAGMAKSAWGVYTNGRDLYNLAKGRKLIAANHVDGERHGEVAVVPPTQLRQHRKKRRGARKARRQNWVTNAYNKVKPYAGPAAGVAQNAWGVYTNGRDLYNLAKGRKLRAATHDSEHIALSSPRRSRRRGLKKHRKARRQNWVTNAYNKVKPYAGPAAGVAQNAWGVYTNGRDLYNLAKGRKLRAMKKQALERQANLRAA